MKRYILHALWVSATMLCLSACQQVKVDAGSFEINITYPKATGLLYEVIPQTNDYYYVCNAVKVADYNRLGERNLVDSLDGMYKEAFDFVRYLYEELGYATPDFMDMLNNGAMYGATYMLEPETEYYLCVMCYNKHKRPIKTIVKKPFVTKDSLASSITFDVKASGTKLVIIPSDDETYFWDVEEKKVIDTRYYGLPTVFYMETVENYERYGFMHTMLVQGRDGIDLADYYTLHTQDTLYLTAAGYHNETNSEIETYELVYQGDNGFSITRVEEDDYFDDDDEDDDAAEQMAKRLLFSKQHILPRLKR